MPDDERIEQLELENKVLQANNKGLKDTIEELRNQNAELRDELEVKNAELEEYKMLFDEANAREYRKRYIAERRKEEPNLYYPDFDEIYERYYQEKEKNKEIQEIKKALETMFNVADEVEKGWRDKIKAKIEELIKIHKERDLTNKESYYLDCYENLLEEK